MSLPVTFFAVTFSAANASPADGPPLGVEAISDASLLLLIQQRNEVAMSRVFERHSRLVYSVALRVLHDQAQAEDVLQEVFMQVWKKPIILDEGRGSLRGLIAVMARNKAIDFVRQRKQTQSTEEFDLPSSFNLATDSERRILLNRVREVAHSLPFQQQSVLQLAFFEGLTHAEIATKTGAPLGTVKTRIRFALRSLQRTTGHGYVRAPRRRPDVTLGNASPVFA